MSLRPPTRLAALLRGAAAVVFVLAVVAVVAPPPVARLAGTAAVALLVGAPAGRVGWLAVAWWRIGDRRYATAAAGVLAVLAVGTIVAAIVH